MSLFAFCQVMRRCQLLLHPEPLKLSSFYKDKRGWRTGGDNYRLISWLSPSGRPDFHLLYCHPLPLRTLEFTVSPDDISLSSAGFGETILGILLYTFYIVSDSHTTWKWKSNTRKERVDKKMLLKKKKNIIQNVATTLHRTVSGVWNWQTEMEFNVHRNEGEIFSKALGRKRVFPQRPIVRYFLKQLYKATNKTTAKQTGVSKHSWVFFRDGCGRQAC